MNTSPFKHRYFDLFGVKPSIGYKNYQTSTNPIGTFFTILIYVLIFVGFLYFGRDIV